MRRQRDALGRTLEQVADASGISRQALGAYELGKRPIAVHVLVRIATALEARPRDLLPDDDTEARAFQDITVRVRTGPGTDLEAVEAALVAVTEDVAEGGRVVAASAPMNYVPDAEPVDVGA